MAHIKQLQKNREFMKQMKRFYSSGPKAPWRIKGRPHRFPHWWHSLNREKQPQFPFAPKDFARCLNATCPRSQNCLRRTAALQDTDEHLFLKVVNPLRYPKEGEECELFRSTDKVRMAWGVTHLLDNVPYKEGSLLRNMIINHLGRSQYYRCFRKERPFAPQDQQTIRMLFRQRGISEEPSFDYYTNEFNW